MSADKPNRRPAARSFKAIDAAVTAWEEDPSMQGIDPRKLKPGELLRLLNVTTLGEVLTRRALDRHRDASGFRIGDGKSIDFFRYAAWLFDLRHSPVWPVEGAGKAAGLSKQAKYSRGKTSEAADIGAIREVANPKRREACRLNLELFLTTYFPASTGLNPFSSDHKRVIARLQEVILRGGREAKAVYRGFAKTTLAENAAIWSQLYGHRRFVAIFGATATASVGNMESIKSELETNDLLDEDFPEVTQAIRDLQGKPQRCGSQTCKGERTHIEWTSKKIALPCIAGSVASGAVITAHGLTAASRGLKHKLPDGTGQRPDLVIVDDPQTDDSAHTPAGVNKRLNVLKKVILRLAGHQRQMSCMVNGTIIEKDDVMDQLTDARLNPAFQSERIKMIRAWGPAHETLWLEQYAKIRNTYDKDDPDDQARAHREATEFYRKHRAEMDAGVDVSWEHCFDPEREISAIQHAYNILIDDGLGVFSSECQQEPLGRDLDEADRPSLLGIAERLNRLKRSVVPLWASKLVAFVDVQGKGLYYVVMAFADDFTGAIVEYGTEPQQPREYFTLRELPRTLPKAMAAAGKTGGEEAAIWFGLDLLEPRLAGRTWVREDKAEIRVERMLVDSGWQTETIYEYCRRSARGSVLMPSKGHAVTASGKPMTEWETKPHEKPGFHFVLTTDATRRAVRLLKFDPHFWKTFVAHRLKCLGPGSLSVYGDQPERHRMLADHFKAEFCEKTFGRGRTVWEWKQLPGQDNHLLDGVVGCYAAAALLGCRLGEQRETLAPKKKPRVTYF